LSSVEVPIGEYVHVAATYDGNEGKIFINGIEGTEIWSVNGSGGDITDNDRSVAFGIIRWGTTNNEGIYDSEILKGNLDEIRIWNTALTQEEIQNNMNIQLSGDESGLVGCWNFDEGTGTQVTDQTSNGNDGTIIGTSLLQLAPIIVPSFPFDV
jgi:hypothetical protein